jgi:hypothetical protein
LVVLGKSLLAGTKDLLEQVQTLADGAALLEVLGELRI